MTTKTKVQLNVERIPAKISIQSTQAFPPREGISIQPVAPRQRRHDCAFVQRDATQSAVLPFAMASGGFRGCMRGMRPHRSYPIDWTGCTFVTYKLTFVL